MRIFTRSILLLLLGASLLAIPGAFINQDFLHRQFDKVLKLKVRETYKGGEKEFRFMDPLNDDKGSGNLTYPNNSMYTDRGEGLLDLVSLTIHKPQTEVDWGSDNIYWQFTYRMQNLASDPDSDALFQNPVINHYFGFNGVSEGRVDTLKTRAELVQFNNEYPWQFVINMNGYKSFATIQSHDQTYKAKVTLMVDKDSNSLIVRVPLDYKPLRYVLKNSGSYHYVIVGGYDSMARGNFVPINRRAGQRSGGGRESSLTPKIYDYLAPKGSTQKSVLTSYNEESYSYATLEPVIAIYGEEDRDSNEITQELINQFKLNAESENREEDIRNREKLSELENSINGSSDINSRIDLAVAYINNSEMEKAEAIISNCLEDEPENAEALANLGTIRAVQGGKSDSISRSMELVYEAFEIYEKALLNVRNKEEELAVRLNRGHVSLSVPESVFVKCLTGADDFLKAAKIYKELYGEQHKKIGDCFLNAALCFKEAGRTDDSEVYFQAALDFPGISAASRYELIKNGYTK